MPSDSDKPQRRKRTKGSRLTFDDRARRIGASREGFLYHRGIVNLRQFVNGAFFNFTIALLILMNVTFIFAEFMVEPGDKLNRIMSVNDSITWIFIVELLTRFVVAPNKRIFFSNFWIDILSVLPALRIFRTFRVFRLLRLLRLTRAVMIIANQSGWISDRFDKLFGSFGALFITTVLLVLCGTLAGLSVEHSQAISANEFLGKLWETTFLFMSGEVIGDLPASEGGKFVSVLVAISGLVVFAILVGTISASMSAYFARKMEAKEIDLSDLKNHLIICGWESMGSIILQELEAVRDVWLQGVVVVAETEEDIVKTSGVKNAGTLFHLREDFTKVEVLEQAGVRRAKTAMVLADKGNNLRAQDRDARTVLAALTLEKLNPQIFTCCELLNDKNAEHLRIAGVEEIVSRVALTAGLFASSAINEGVTPVITDLMTHHQGNYLRKITVPKEFIGKNYFDVLSHFKREYDALVIALEEINEREEYTQHVNPSSSHIVQAKDRVTVIVKRDSELCDLSL